MSNQRQQILLAVAGSVLFLVVVGGVGSWWWQKERARQDAEFGKKPEVVAEEAEVVAAEPGVKRKDKTPKKAPLVKQGPEEAPSKKEKGPPTDPEDAMMIARLDAIHNDLETPEKTGDEIPNTTVYANGVITADDARRQRMAYQRAFADYGMVVREMKVQEAAEKIRSRPAHVSQALLDALEQWNRLIPGNLGISRIPNVQLYVVPGGVADEQGEIRSGDQLIAITVGGSDSFQTLKRADFLGSIADLDGPAGEVVRLKIRPAQLKVDLKDKIVTLTRTDRSPEKEWLQEVVEAADTDSWRKKVRLATRKYDFDALEKLATNLDVLNQRPATLLALASNLGLKDAKALLKHAYRRSPDNRPINFQLGLLNFYTGDNAVALVHFQKVMELRSHNKPWMLLARTYQNLGQEKMSLDTLVNWLQTEPESSEAHNEIGQLLSEDGDMERAIFLLRKATQLDPSNQTAHCNLGLALEKIDDFDAAIASYRRALELNPNQVVVLTSLGNALYKRGEQGDLQAGLVVKKKAIELDPENVSQINIYGLMLAENREYDAAIAQFKKTIELQSNYAIGYFNMGMNYWRKRDLDEAVQAFETYLKFDPSYPPAWSSLGSVRLLQGDQQKAAEGFQQALLLNPRYINALNGLTQLSKEQVDLEKPIALLRRIVQFDPDFTVARYTLGYVLKSNGETQEAIDHFKKVIELDPEMITARYALGMTYREGGDLNQAAKVLRHVMELDPDQELIHSNLGAVLLYKGDYVEARKYLQESLQQDPDLTKSHFNLALCLFKEDKPEQAGELLDREIARLRTQENRLKDLERLLAIRGHYLVEYKKYDEAEPICREVLKLREKSVPRHWSYFMTQSTLGAALLGQGESLKETDKEAAAKKLVEAETLLLSGAEGMLKNAQSLSFVNKGRLIDALQRVVRFYEVTEQPEKVKEWKEKIPQ